MVVLLMVDRKLAPRGQLQRPGWPGGWGGVGFGRRESAWSGRHGTEGKEAASPKNQGH